MELTGRRRRVAFFGGSFDPPHLGHLTIAHAAMGALDLDTVLFAPVGIQPLKGDASTACFQDRLAMTALAIASQHGMAVSLADVPKRSGAPNFTFDTLQNLRAGLPADGELFCLMGADSFFSLSQWHRAAEIPFAATLIVASRPGQALDDLRAALPQGLTIDLATHPVETVHSAGAVEYEIRNLAGECAHFYFLPGLNVEISASDIRHQVHAAEGVAKDGLLPPAVFEYICSHELYR